MTISVEKWLVMAALAVISFGLGILPYFIMKKVQQMRKNILHHATYHLMLTVLSCFGAGVLLTTTAMHMIPEVRESLEAHRPKLWNDLNLDEHFPIGEVLMLVGLSLIYFVEEIAHFIMVDPDHSHSHHHGITRHSSMAHAIPVAIPGGPRPSLLSTKDSITNFNMITSPSGVSITLQAPDEFTEDKMRNNGDGSGASLTGSNFTHSGFGSKFRSFLALIALSFHAIIEGIAIGVQNTSNVWLMFGAIASHKFVISFCMGMELCASRARMGTILSSILLFAVLSPVGIFIGSYLTEDDSHKSLGVIVVEGFASGTLLYVAFFEILNRERERKSGVLKKYRFSGFVQFLSLALGLVAMGFLLTSNDHGHGDDGPDHHDDDHTHASVNFVNLVKEIPNVF